MDWLDLHAVQGTLKSLLQHHSSKGSILQHSAFFIVQLSHSYKTTGKTIALTRQTFVGKVMSLLFNVLSRYDLNQILYDYTVEVRNRFKGLDLIDRVPDELWTEVRHIVQETGIKTIPMQKKCKKAKWLSEEALLIAVKRREAKSKGEKERYKHLNAEFQRIARRDKKAFFSDQCKEIEENNRMGKTKDLFKKIKRYQGNISCKGAR